MRILIFLSFLLVLESCTSLEDLHRDKVEFVKSLMGNSDTCLIKIKQSKYYKEGITRIGTETCCKLNSYFNDNKVEALEIEIDFSDPKFNKNKPRLVYVLIGNPNERIKVVFEFFDEDFNKGILKSIGISD